MNPTPASRNNRFGLNETQAALLAQFLRFGVVGAICFCVDTSVVYATRSRLGLYAAATLSYVVAATVGWALNRCWTFRRHGAGGRALHRQWASFLIAGLIGFTINRGIYFVLITASPFCAAIPVIPLAFGAGGGMFVNFALSRRLVFR